MNPHRERGGMVADVRRVEGTKPWRRISSELGDRPVEEVQLEPLVDAHPFHIAASMALIMLWVADPCSFLNGPR